MNYHVPDRKKKTDDDPVTRKEFDDMIYSVNDIFRDIQEKLEKLESLKKSLDT